jgi:ketosteroid isomerase-like protein
MDTRELVEQFYISLAAKDDRWQEHLAADVEFADASGRLSAHGREAFIQAFTGFLRAVESVRLKQLIVDGAAAAAVVGYGYRNPSGERLEQDDAEIWRIEGGEIASLTIYFDITEFSAFMRR